MKQINHSNYVEDVGSHFDDSFIRIYKYLRYDAEILSSLRKYLGIIFMNLTVIKNVYFIVNSKYLTRNTRTFFYRSFSLKMKLTLVFYSSTSVWFESINFPLKIAISFIFSMVSSLLSSTCILYLYRHHHCSHHCHPNSHHYMYHYPC